MHHTLTRSLIETLVRNKLEDLRTSPERTTRNLVDMALHFSKGRFQKRFFEIAQSMLKDEKNPYYQMLHYAVATVDNERLVHFGMNLGYNSCTYGAQIIRKTEKQLMFNVPWCITLELSKESILTSPEHYHSIMQEGKSLGIYTWHIFSNNCLEEFLPIIEMNPDCAFFLFCDPAELNETTLESYSFIQNAMFVIKYQADNSDIYSSLKKYKFLYSTYLYYSDINAADILNNELLCEIIESDSSFAVFIPDETCSDDIKAKISDYTINMINQPVYKTIPFDFSYHLKKIDSIISEDSCSVWFDENGSLIFDKNANHFTQSLSCILHNVFPKKH